MNNVQVTFTICAGFDGGIIVYESDSHDSRLVFGGDHKAATEYLSNRMAKLIDDNANEIAPVREEYLSNPPPAPLKLPQRAVSSKLADRLQRIDEVTEV